MEASDDIAYISSDFQDAIKLKLISKDEALQILEDMEFVGSKAEYSGINEWGDLLKKCFEQDDFSKVSSALINSPYARQTCGSFLKH
jgi:dGTP triphosphohydrolase